MLDALIDPILPVFAIMALGYLGGKLGRVSDADARVLNSFAMSVLLPIFVFRATALAPWASFEIGPLLLYATAQVLLYSVGYAVIRALFGLPRTESLLLAFCGIFANNAYYGLPIAQLLFGPDQVGPMISVIMLDVTLAFGGTMVTLEVLSGRDAGAGVGLVLRRIAGLPLVWALAAGICCGVLALPLPGPVDTFTGFVGQAASPLALFAMGVILASTPIRADAVVWLVTGVKVLVFPGLVWVFMTFVADTTASADFVFASAGPAGAMAAAMALLYRVRTDAIMQVTVLTSLLTLGSLAFLS